MPRTLLTRMREENTASGARPGYRAFCPGLSVEGSGRCSGEARSNFRWVRLHMSTRVGFMQRPEKPNLGFVWIAGTVHVGDPSF